MADGAVEAVEVGEGSDPSSSSGRSLRKRRIDLNRLASSVSLPLVCQFQHCGVRLADGDSLEVSAVFNGELQAVQISLFFKSGTTRVT